MEFGRQERHVVHVERKAAETPVATATLPVAECCRVELLLILLPLPPLPPWLR